MLFISPLDGKMNQSGKKAAGNLKRIALAVSQTGAAETQYLSYRAPFLRPNVLRRACGVESQLEQNNGGSI